MAYHSLNTRVAKQCGVNAALIFHYLHFWIDKNRANEKHFHDGRYWTYCSMDGFCRILDYLSPKQIRTAIERLEQEGYIVKGSYNKSSYDRTTWYAITEAGYALLRDTETANPVAFEENSICPDGQMEAPETANQSAAEGNSIEEPVIITDTTTDIIPPNPPKGGTGDAPGESAPVPDKPTRKRERNPSRSPDLTPDEEAAFLAFSPGLCEAARDWFRHKAEIKKPYNTPTSRRQFVSRVCDNAQRYGPDAVERLIRDSVSNGYQGVIWDKLPQAQYGGRGGGRNDDEEWERAFDMVHAALEGRAGQ